MTVIKLLSVKYPILMRNKLLNFINNFFLCNSCILKSYWEYNIRG